MSLSSIHMQHNYVTTLPGSCDLAPFKQISCYSVVKKICLFLVYTEPKQPGIMPPPCMILDSIITSDIRGVTYNTTASALSRHAGSPFYTDIRPAMGLPSLPSYCMNNNVCPFHVCTFYTERRHGIKVQHSGLEQAV